MRKQRLRSAQFFNILMVSAGLTVIPGCKFLGLEKETETIADSDISARVDVQGPPEKVGRWETRPAPPASVAVQAIHAVLLPNGKILLVNGSSNRDGVKSNIFGHNDNSAVVDPLAGDHGFTKISSFPKTKVDAAVAAARAAGRPTDMNSLTAEHIDLFCTGHLQMWDGNVLFAGGTRTYQDNFRGSRKLWSFNYRTNSFTDISLMTDGRWYPTLVPLPDGKIMIISGLLHQDDQKLKNSRKIEFYDPFRQGADRLKAVDIGAMANSPFEGGQLDHYPRIVSTKDGRFLFTSDGTGVGNRTKRSTSLMSIRSPMVWPPVVSFAKGPDRSLPGRVYGTAFVDPNSPNGDIVLLGGLSGSNDNSFAPNFPVANAKILPALERWRLDGGTTGVGGWSLQKDFLGTKPTDVRTGHYTIILPTKELLVINGGNYTNHGGMFNPLLLTPGAPREFFKTLMVPAKNPRFYHNTALLLPDGRVWVAGGNRMRALRRPDGTIDQRLHGSEGRTDMPAELTETEIFSPPYLFTPGARPEIVQAPESVKYGQEVPITVRNSTQDTSVVFIKLGSATHGWDNGQRLMEATVTAKPDAAGVMRIKIPDNPNLAPPGYYMMFFISGQKKPSKAVMVRLDVKR
jgi:hypothetical protein